MPEGTSTTPAPGPAGGLRDFSDRLPPVLVKELRQGLRGRMFVVPFLALQGLLILSSGSGTKGETLFFWHCLAIMLVALLPSRNLSALGEERQANTLDTLILTRLTPWRIVWGKWCATAAQSTLTAVAATPYLLVRYLNNGTDFVHEGLLLFMLLLLSGAVAGVFTAFSTVTSPLVRHGLATGLLAVVYGAFLLPLIRALIAGNVPDFSVLSPMTVTALWAGLFSLWQAASTIAPAASNLTTPRRLVSLAAILLFAGLSLTFVPPGFALASGALVVLVITSMVEMGERMPESAFLAPAGRHRRWISRLTALVFQRGWASGVFFCAALWGMAVMLAPGRFDAGFLQVPALCFFPVVARFLLPARARMGTGPMLLLAVFAHVLSLLLSSLLPVELQTLARALPSIRRDPGDDGFRFATTAIWAGSALVLAVAYLLSQSFNRRQLPLPAQKPADFPRHFD